MYTIHRSMLLLALLFSTEAALPADSTTAPESAEKRFFIAIGAFRPNIDSEARLDRKDLGTGTEIDFESDLGLKDTDTLFTFLLSAQLSKRWRTELEWFQLNRRKRTVIDEQIIWGDETFDIGADIKTEFNLDIYRLGFNYTFIMKPNTEGGLSLGTHITRFDTKLSAVGTGAISGSISSEGGNVTAPLPNVGIYLNQKLANKLNGNLRLDYFKIELGDFGGSLISTGLNLIYHVNDTWGLNAGYRYFKLNANLDSDAWKGRIDYAYHGPIVMVYTHF